VAAAQQDVQRQLAFLLHQQQRLEAQHGVAQAGLQQLTGALQQEACESRQAAADLQVQQLQQGKLLVDYMQTIDTIKEQLYGQIAGIKQQLADQQQQGAV
jgi:hypothetical protein